MLTFSFVTVYVISTPLYLVSYYSCMTSLLCNFRNAVLEQIHAVGLIFEKTLLAFYKMFYKHHIL